MNDEKADRERIQAQFTNKVLQVLNEIEPTKSLKLGCELQRGTSVLEKLQVARDTAMAKATQRVSTQPFNALASVRFRWYFGIQQFNSFHNPKDHTQKEVNSKPVKCQYFSKFTGFIQIIHIQLLHSAAIKTFCSTLLCNPYLSKDQQWVTRSSTKP